LFGPAGRDSYPQQFAQALDGQLPEIMRWIPGLYRSAAQRTGQLQRQAERQFPGIFDRLDSARAARDGAWPAWCWMPISEVIAVLQLHYADRTTRPHLPAGPVPELAAMADLAGDAARLASIGSWRHAGRHVVNLHGELVERFEKWDDRLPRNLAGRWPVGCVYIAFEAVYGSLDSGSMGLFMHLEWDEREQRTELRLLTDLEPAATFQHLVAQPVHLTGTTLSGALAATGAAVVMRERSRAGDDRILYTSPGSPAAAAARKAANKVRVWVAAADHLASGQAVLQDAAGVLGRRASGETWPPAARPVRKSPVLWLAAPAG
jgi:hypothetical protein